MWRLYGKIIKKKYVIRVVNFSVIKLSIAQLSSKFNVITEVMNQMNDNQIQIYNKYDEFSTTLIKIDADVQGLIKELKNFKLSKLQSLVSQRSLKENEEIVSLEKLIETHELDLPLLDIEKFLNFEETLKDSHSAASSDLVIFNVFC